MGKGSTLPKPRILLVGTASIHLVNYASLVAGEVELHVVSNTALDVPLAESVRISSLSMRPVFAIPRRIRALKKIIAELNPDVIHVHQANTCAFYALRASSGIPVLVTAWGSDVLVRSSNFLNRLLLRFILERGAAFTASCQYIVEKMNEIRSLKDKSVTVANFGIEDNFPTVKKEKIIYSNRYLNPIYRVERIIREFAAFTASAGGEGWKLVIAGSGSEEARLKALVKELGIPEQVQFTGWLNPSENRLWYARASVYAALPTSDSTSISLYEAMAAGCVPVVSDLPANREVITDRQNGVLVDDHEQHFFERAVSMVGSEFLKSNRLLSLERAGKPQNRERFLRIYASLCHGH